MIPWLANDAPFPALTSALDEPNGLLAAGGDLSPERLLAAYRNGIFPWYSEGQPVLWWSPDPRMVLYVDEFKVSRSLRRRIRQGAFELRVDTDFRRVVSACASARRAGQYGTWITPAVMRAYVDMHERGYAHSVEAWCDDELVGGLYGLALGKVFFGESMFARAPDASKVALAGLIALLGQLGVPLVDCQQETTHLASLGARPVARSDFAAQLSRLIHSLEPPSGWIRGVLRVPREQTE
jgi:leucyl/phenylalanyl-tRNA--protein transferase